MRKIFVSVVVRSTKRGIEWISESEAKVWVHASPQKGKANAEVCDIIAHSLDIPRWCVRVSAGETSRKKIIMLSDPII